MGKEYVNQHIVPKRYLDRFASQMDDKRIIDTRLCTKGKVKFFLESTDSVGFIKNYYDVSDKEDPKYWEHFFANEIDSLCGKELNNIISTITMSRKGAAILTDSSKRILSKIIVAQLFRTPNSINYTFSIYPVVARKTKDNILSVLPSELLEKYKERINAVEMTKEQQKEQHLNYLFDPENFEKYCKIVRDRVWIVYVNIVRNNMPFVTCDNPVLIESIETNEIGLFKNGLANPATCIFYPITPSIAVARYSKSGPIGIIENEIGDKVVYVDDIRFIGNKNIRLMDQAYLHSFIPQPLYDSIVKNSL